MLPTFFGRVERAMNGNSTSVRARANAVRLRGTSGKGVDCGAYRRSSCWLPQEITQCTAHSGHHPP